MFKGRKPFQLEIRGKIFMLAIGLSTVLIAVFGFALEQRLRASIYDQVEAELERHARSARILLERRAVSLNVSAVDGFADEFAKATDTRVTVIAKDGKVLGDSTLSPGEIQHAPSHYDRPEVSMAQTEGRGVTTRYSATLAADMLYIALPFYNREELAGVVRVAMPLMQIQDAVWHLRWVLSLVAVSVLVIAGVLAFAVSSMLTRAVRSIVNVTKSVASGQSSEKPWPKWIKQDLGGLTGSVEQLARNLEATLSTLAAERDRFAAVLQSMVEAVIVVDAEQKVLVMNPAAFLLLGLPENAKFENLSEIGVEQLLELAGQAVYESPQNTEFSVHIPSERKALARAICSPRGDVAIVIHDVTEIRKLETVRRDFVANVSHELRTPVSVIRANAETLLEEGLSKEEAQPFVAAMFRNADRLGHLISDLLDISRIEAGRYPLDLQPLGLSQAVTKVLQSMETKAREKNVSIDNLVAASFVVEADSKAVDQVLVNLIDNAIKYTTESGHVEVHGFLQGGFIRIEVRDDGPGIDPAHRLRVFERFYRVDAGRSRHMGGTGLGLAIAKHLVEAMNGRIGVDANQPRGSIFWFTLPQSE